MKRTTTIIGLSVVAVLLAAATFMGGFVVGHVSDVTGWFRSVPAPSTAVSEQVQEVLRILNRQALMPSSEESMTAGAIQGLLDSLDDPHAMYFDAEHFEFFTDHTDGDFGGVGINISQREEVVFVVSVIEGTPAEEAGIQPDDEFVGVDGVTRERWTVDEIVKRVRGPEGTTVELEMRREGDDELLTFTVERANIEIPNVESELIDDVGYIKLLTFNLRSSASLADEIEKLTAEGATSFVIDVRNNPGGLLSSSVEVASLFIADGVVVRVEERERAPIEHRARGGVATDAPVVLLVNENSASASEVLAGALQDYGRATIVGAKTFGKGSVQTVEELRSGGGIKFTIAHYVTPQGRVIEGVGLEPDIVVDMDPMAQHHDDEPDIQLERAIEEARKAAR